MDNLILRVRNGTGLNIQSFAVGYVAKIFRSAGSGGEVSFSYSTDGANWIPVPSANASLTHNSTGYFFGSPIAFSVPARTFTVPEFRPNADLYFRWHIIYSGNGLGPAIDDIWITPVSSSIAPSDFSVLSIGTGQVQITGYSGNASSVTVPSTIGNNSVVGIGHMAFAYKTGITFVELPNTIKYIDMDAFWGCNNMESITLPYGIERIGVSAFKNCTKLTKVTIPASVTEIEDYAFGGCSAFTDLGILYGVTSVGRYAFADCVSLRDVIVPGSVTRVGDFAFANCSNLEAIWISYGTRSIGEYAFSNCFSLRSVTLPSTLEQIDSKSFTNCRNLTNITVPSSVFSVNWNAFDSCSSLTSINVHAGNPNFSSLDGAVFNKARTQLLKFPAGKSGDYSIPHGVEYLEELSFYECKNLERLVIPPSVWQIDSSAFNGCSGLTDVVMPYNISSSFQDSRYLRGVMRYSMENSEIIIKE